jgi:hypothetical protein
MRKTFLLAIAVATAITSCQNDDSNSGNSELKLITTSNTTGNISITDLKETTPTVSNFTIPSTDADGAYYSSSDDEIIIASRTNNKLEVYSNIKNAMNTGMTSLSVSLSSLSDFNNPREIAVSNNMIVVTQDQNAANLNTNKLLVYQKTNDGLNLVKTFTVDFKVWGIHVYQNTLYAVADLTSDIVVFENFFANASGAITPTKRVTIEGLVRTHGITFSDSEGTMVLTDVGSATSDSDGGIIVINNFQSVLNATPNNGTIANANQVRIYGSATKLGNPVDVAYDKVTGKIYVAERLNAGGQVLVFAKPTANGNIAPIESRAEAGVSSVFLLRK